MSLISAISFVPQGHAAEFPTKYKLTEEEFERIQGLSALHLSSARSDLSLAQKVHKNGDTELADVDEEEEEEVPISAATQSVDDELAEYNLDDYDDDEGEQMGIFNNIKGLAFHKHGEEDPYITLQDGGADSDDDEREELQILPTDNIILAAKTEDDISHLEVYVYEEDSANLYVHHDILLPSFPLCLEWVNFSPAAGQSDSSSQTGGVNNVAIGTFEPDIEIWDLDTLDALFPTTILGAKPGTKRRKKKNDKYHIDAVLGLSANPNAKNLLASASADETLKLWDLTSGTCAQSYNLHDDKVSAVLWNPKTPTTIATGGCDQRTIISDARMPEKAVQTYSVGSDVENLAWDTFNEHIIYTSTDNGMLFAHDIRNTASLWRIQAHDGPLSAFSVSPAVPGLVATGGQDKQIKLWSTISAKPTMLTSRDFDIGKVFSLGFIPDQGMQLVAGGTNGIVRVWDTMTNPGVRKAFKSNSAVARRQAKENSAASTENGAQSVEQDVEIEDRVIGLQDKDGPESDESDSESDAGAEEMEAMELEDVDESESEDEDNLMEDADFQGDEKWQKEQKKKRNSKK